MKNNQIVLANRNKCERFMRIGVLALIVVMFMAFAVAPSIMTTFAVDQEVETTLNNVVGTIVGIIAMAAKYIGIVIVLWGVFNIVMALRREDSEAIGKQITTVAVGAVLAGFGFFIKPICAALGVDIDI